MKFGEYLLSQRISTWESYYLNYEGLKTTIEELEELNLIAPSTTSKGLQLSRLSFCSYFF